VNHDFEQTLHRILFELTAIPAEDIKPEHKLRADLGLDSVASMELVSMLSEEMNIDISIAVEDVRGVLELADRYLAHA
jgi:acyl carrier protein